MKKVSFVGSCLAVFLTSFSAYAVNIKPFVGGNIAINNAIYADDIKYAMNNLGIDLSSSFLGLGGELGV